MRRIFRFKEAVKKGVRGEDAKRQSLIKKILRQEGTKALGEVCQDEIIYPHPLRAGKEFQHEFTSVRNSGAGSKRFFGLRMKRHCGLDPQSHNGGNASISEIRMERLRSQSHYNEITTQTTFARNDNVL